MKEMLSRWSSAVLRKLGCALAGMTVCFAASAQSVAFINPGKSDETYWVTVSKVMQQAANSLGMSLEIIYGERNRLAPIEIAKAIAQRPQGTRPKYLIVPNEYNAAPEILRVLDGSGIRVLMAFSGVRGETRSVVGEPRTKYANWLGSLEPRAEDAGYLTAKALIDTARKMPELRGIDGKWHFVAVAGDRSTTVSVARNAGMMRAVRESKDIVFTQEVYGDWNKNKAREQAEVLFKRYPQARLVWAGNDQMAFGAMEAWEAQGGKPGKDALFSAINTSVEALEARRSGALTALAGGHFMAGGWAMVMLYDFERGIDFLDEGMELEYPMFILFDERNIPAFEERFMQVHSKLDFKSFTKTHNKSLKRYDFDIQLLLK